MCSDKCNTHIYGSCSAIVEGKDSHSNLKDIYGSFRHRIHSEIVAYTRPKRDGIVFATHNMHVRFWGGGDMAFTSEILGLGAHFNRKGFNCCWCEVHTDCLASSSKSTNRTLPRLYNLAHLPIPHTLLRGDGPLAETPFPFTCPGCKKVFDDQEVSNSQKMCTCSAKSSVVVECSVFFHRQIWENRMCPLIFFCLR